MLALAAAVAPAANGSVFTGGPITIPAQGQGSPFPSLILEPASPEPSHSELLLIRVTLMGVTHTFPDDLDILLLRERASVGFPSQPTFMLMSDACSSLDLNGAQFVFDVRPFPTGNLPKIPDTQMPPCTSTAYEPANYGEIEQADLLGTGFPAQGAGIFGPGDFSGKWALFVFDDEAPDGGSIAGWKLELFPVATCTPKWATKAAAPLVTNRPENFGTSGDETITGTPGPDLIFGFGGKDRILGLGGNDVICGGDDSDNIAGGPGNDLILGEGGKDKTIGGGGKDKCIGGAKADKAKGCEKEKKI